MCFTYYVTVHCESIYDTMEKGKLKGQRTVVVRSLGEVLLTKGHHREILGLKTVMINYIESKNNTECRKKGAKVVLKSRTLNN